MKTPNVNLYMALSPCAASICGQKAADALQQLLLDGRRHLVWQRRRVSLAKARDSFGKWGGDSLRPLGVISATSSSALTASSPLVRIHSNKRGRRRSSQRAD